MENIIVKNVLANIPKVQKSLLEFKSVLVVLGNETCDLDSAVSSLVYSLFLNHIKTCPEKIVIPVLNIPRKLLPIKTEVNYFLGKNGVLDGVPCRDEIDLAYLHARGSLQLVLVDHHTLGSLDHQLISSVVEVIDHRPADPAWPWVNADLTLQTVASCCTLIADKLLSIAPQLVTPSVATLLLGTILVDSACLSKEAGRATPLDHRIVECLQNYCTSPINEKELYNEILAAKSDISTLTTAQLLIKDLKVTAGIPIAGLPIKVKEFLERDDASTSAQQFCKDHNTEVCIIYGQGIENGKLSRDIAVFSNTSPDKAGQVIAALKSCSDPCLNLQAVPCAIKGFTHFEQLNIKATRKQILPIVREIGEKFHD